MIDYQKLPRLASNSEQMKSMRLMRPSQRIIDVLTAGLDLLRFDSWRTEFCLSRKGSTPAKTIIGGQILTVWVFRLL